MLIRRSPFFPPVAPLPPREIERPDKRFLPGADTRRSFASFLCAIHFLRDGIQRDGNVRRRYFMPGYPRFVCAVYPGQDSGFNALPGALNGEGSLKGFIWWLEKANGLVFGFLFLFPSSFLMESIVALSIEKSSSPFRLFIFSVIVIFIFKIEQVALRMRITFWLERYSTLF